MTHFYLRICPEGHFEIDYRRVKPDHVCRECGAPLIDECPECGRIIKEWHFYGTSMMPPRAEGYMPPDVCPGYGRVFPWAGKDTVRRVPNRQKR